MDKLQALYAGAVQPPEGKSAAPEDPDGEIRGSRGSPIRMRVMDPSYMPLQHAPYCMSQDVASNSRCLVQLSYKDALERTASKNIKTTVRTRRLLWLGALLRMGEHRLLKRVISGELESAGQRWTDCVEENRRVLRGGWSTPHKTLGFGTTQDARGLHIYGRVGEGRGKDDRTQAVEERGRSGGQG